MWKRFQLILASGAQFVVALDCDGQHNPEDMPHLPNVAEWSPQHIVIGARLHDKKSFPARHYSTNQFARFWISWAAGYPISDTQSGFRVSPAALFKKIKDRDFAWNGFVFESEVLIEAGALGMQSIAVAILGIYPKQARPSHFRPVHDIARLVMMVAGRLLRRGMHPLGL